MHMRKSDVKLTGKVLSIRRKLMSVAVNPSLTLAAPAGSVFFFQFKVFENSVALRFIIGVYFVLFRLVTSYSSLLNKTFKCLLCITFNKFFRAR